MEKTLNLIKSDPWLEPYAAAITGRHQYAMDKETELTNGGKQTLSDFASGYLYFGLHRTDKGWTFREWAPNATHIYMVGTFNNWEEKEEYSLKRLQNGNWEINLPANAMQHGDLYKLIVYWDGGQGERIPAWATRVVQDENTKIFSAQVWNPEKPFKFRKKTFKPSTDPLLIYECHIGMAQQEEKVGTYSEFREKILPRIAKAGYNCIQIMAIQEHPYYGSFGYHVSSFFAASSRFGTPEELKELIDTAHGLGIAVIMDIVHSHAVKNEVEGLGNFAGDPNQYFYPGARREHPAWDSLCFDYGKNEVIHFLLSNCKYWLEEYQFDGFRFDGVTSMLYYSHGLGESFSNYGDYFNGHEDDNAMCYLTLANELIHMVNPKAITIAEEVSGMPGLAAKVEDGGYGFNYRMAMNIPDYWIKTIKEKIDEDWKPSSMFWEVINRRQDEKTISYAESHDQALVGDKTIIFRLIDADMYWHMQKGDENYTVNRGIALHKMIRLLTATTINGGYLNFMGNEFGQLREWDESREQDWDILKYPIHDTFHHFMRELNHLYMTTPALSAKDYENAGFQWLDCHQEERCIYAFERTDGKDRIVAVFNFSDEDQKGYELPIKDAKELEVILASDDVAFGGGKKYTKKKVKVTDGKAVLDLSAYSAVYFGI